MTIGIYSITNKITGKRYIGKSINIERRFTDHRCSLKKKECGKSTNRHLFNSVKEYGIDCFDFEIIEKFETVDESAIAEAELKWIRYYKTTDGKFGYNFRLDSDTGMIVHDETRLLMSKSRRGSDNPNFNNKWSQDQKDRMSKIAKERHSAGYYGDEWKSKISEASTQMWTNETKKLEMAKKVSLKKRKYNFHQYTKDGVFIRTWESVEEIINDNPSFKWQNIYSVCNGYKKSYMGFVWKKEPKI